MNTIDRIIEMMRDGAKISYALEQVCTFNISACFTEV